LTIITINDIISNNISDFTMSQLIWKQPQIINWCQLLLNSYHHFLGKDLIERKGTPEEQSQLVFESPFVVLSHGNEVDPIYNYANQMGLDLWEISWEDLIKMPSRLSAETILREEREQILNATAKHGYFTNYQCIRISKGGKRYQIKGLDLWNILDQEGVYLGQAATFSQWEII
jgi:hypothetical protein